MGGLQDESKNYGSRAFNNNNSSKKPLELLTQEDKDSILNEMRSKSLLSLIASIGRHVYLGAENYIPAESS